MLPYAYRLAGNAKTAAAADYIPSLIAIDTQQISPAPTDIYFERTDLSTAGVNLTALSLTRWVSYDNAPSAQRDPIVGLATNVKTPLYLTLSELVEIGDETTDPDLRDLITTFARSVRL